jgi:hypothetical protein
MIEPMMVRMCLHKFCRGCLNSQESGYQGNVLPHRNCPMCKAKIGNKRLFLKDEVLFTVIRKFLPNDQTIEKFNILEGII